MSLPSRITAILKTGVEYKSAKMLAKVIDLDSNKLVLTDDDGTEHMLGVGTDGKATLDGDPLSSGGGGINGPGDVTAPGQVQNVSVFSIGVAQASVSWDFPTSLGSPAADEFLVVWYTADGTPVGQQTVDASSNSWTITGLTTVTDYVVDVFTVRSQDMSASARTRAAFTTAIGPTNAHADAPEISSQLTGHLTGVDLGQFDTAEGSPWDGQIGEGNGNSGWLKYTCTVGGTATFGVFGNPDDLDTYLSIIDQNTNAIVAHDDDSGGAHGQNGGSSWLQMTVAAGDVYFIRLATAGGGGGLADFTWDIPG